MEGRRGILKERMDARRHAIRVVAESHVVARVDEPPSAVSVSAIRTSIHVAGCARPSSSVRLRSRATCRWTLAKCRHNSRSWSGSPAMRSSYPPPPPATRMSGLFETIVKPAARQLGFAGAERADETNQPGLITNTVIERIVNGPGVVADLSGRNPNVPSHKLRGGPSSSWWRPEPTRRIRLQPMLQPAIPRLIQDLDHRIMRKLEADRLDGDGIRALVDDIDEELESTRLAAVIAQESARYMDFDVRSGTSRTVSWARSSFRVAQDP